MLGDEPSEDLVGVEWADILFDSRLSCCRYGLLLDGWRTGNVESLLMRVHDASSDLVARGWQQ